jgi:hypothetical protein
MSHLYVSAVSEGFDSVNVKLRVWNIIVGLQNHIVAIRHVKRDMCICLMAAVLVGVERPAALIDQCQA